MKILSLHIENFGKLSGYDMVFSDGLNVINAPNAWGKTTLATFIKAMFYGMEKKGNLKAYAAERSKYLPWQGGVYGGSLMFEAGGKQYRVLRNFGLTPEGDRFELIDLATNKQSKDFSSSLGEELFGVGRETFAISTFFPQGMLEGAINDEVRSHLSGANVFGSDLENHSSAIKKLKSRARELNLQNPKMHEILSLQNEIEDGKLELTRQQEQKAQLKARRALLDAAIKNFKPCEAKPDGDISKLNEQLQEIVKKQRELDEKKIAFLKKQKKDKIAKAFFGFLGLAVGITGALLCGLNLTLVAGIVLIAVGVIGGTTMLILTKLVKKQEQPNISGFDRESAELERKAREISEKIKNFSSAAEQAISSVKERAELEKSLAVCEANLAHTNKDIANLMEEIDENEIKLNSMKSKKEECEKKLAIVTLVIEFLNKAQENVSGRYVQPMQQKFSEIISQLSVDRSIRLDVDLNLAVDTQIGMKEKQFLSRGKQDLVEICKRFALIESIFEGEKPFIVLDDPFVNLDEPSLDASLKLIKKFASRFQIIHLVCHSSRA